MIDNPQLTNELIAKLQDALPLPATITPYLADALRKQAPKTSIPKSCEVVWVSNAGDEGGIVCELALGEQDQAAFFVSISHLAFDARHRLTREITAYQKRRIRKLRRQNG